MGDLSQLRQLIIQKWPEAVLSKAGLSEPIFHTGIADIDALFPRQGIPYGQLIEITGAVGSGKTSLLFMMLATLTKSGTVAYIDLSGSFFPTAAASCGVDIEKLSVVKPDNFVVGLRSAELLLSHQMVDSVVVDLTSVHPSTSRLCHNAVSLGLDPDEVGSVTLRFSVKRCWEVTSKTTGSHPPRRTRTGGTCNCDTACSLRVTRNDQSCRAGLSSNLPTVAGSLLRRTFGETDPPYGISEIAAATPSKATRGRVVRNDGSGCPTPPSYSHMARQVRFPPV